MTSYPMNLIGFSIELHKHHAAGWITIGKKGIRIFAGQEQS